MPAARTEPAKKPVARIWSARAGRYYKITVPAAPPTPEPPRVRFEREYVPLRGKMVRWARAQIHCHTDAEDMVHDALLHIMLVTDVGRADVNPEAHAFQTIRNLARVVRERRKRHVSIDHPDVQEEAHLAR